MSGLRAAYLRDAHGLAPALRRGLGEPDLLARLERREVRRRNVLDEREAKGALRLDCRQELGARRLR